MPCFNITSQLSLCDIISQCVLSKPVTLFIYCMYFLVFSEEILETPILYPVLKVVGIQNCPAPTLKLLENSEGVSHPSTTQSWEVFKTRK